MERQHQPAYHSLPLPQSLLLPCEVHLAVHMYQHLVEERLRALEGVTAEMDAVTIPSPGKKGGRKGYIP